MHIYLFINILSFFWVSRYTNNRSNSFVEDGILYIKPTLTSDFIGEQALREGGRINLW